LLDAIVGCEIYHKDMMEKLKKKVDAAPQKKTIPMIIYQNGKAMKVWREVSF